MKRPWWLDARCYLGGALVWGSGMALMAWSVWGWEMPVMWQRVLGGVLGILVGLGIQALFLDRGRDDG